jgi:hypothetical protein
VIASSNERIVTLKSAQSLLGRVTDAKTGQPIPNFRAYQILEFSPDNLCGVRNKNQVAGKAGLFRMPFQRADTDYRVLIEADGYRSAISKASLIKNGIKEQNFALEPASPVTGRILDTNGKPVSGATISLANSFQVFGIEDDISNQSTVTDDKGTYRFPAQPEDFSIVASNEIGFARQDCRASDTNLGDLRLQQWASVSGSLWQDGKLQPNQDISIFQLEPEASNGPLLRLA